MITTRIVQTQKITHTAVLESKCWDNRVYMVAGLAVQLGLTLGDLGAIAEAIIEIEVGDVEPNGEPESVDILDAKALDI